MGTRFIATEECNVPAASIRGVGLDPDDLTAPQALLCTSIPEHIRAWRDVWSAGHGVELIDDIPTVGGLAERLRCDYLPGELHPRKRERT